MNQYAIIESGNKQYRVAPQTVIEVDCLNLEPDQKEVTLEKVLLVRNEKAVSIGSPHVKNAKVVCDYLGEMRGKKVISFKYRRRKASRRIRGHRQNYSKLRVREIVAAG